MNNFEKEFFINEEDDRHLIDDQLQADDDVLMEQIIENINNTPLGQVLNKIASLPEGSQKKVISMRRKLTDSEYNLDDRLDAALEKVLDNFTP